MHNNRTTLKKLYGFFIVFLAFSILYISFNSKNYTAIDGSVRSANVFYENKPFIHGNNHMLYPIHVFYFNKMLKNFGIESKDAFAYFEHSTMINAMAGALSLGILFLILLELTMNYPFSLLGVFITGFSYSFVINATNPNEPMPGLMFSVLSIWLSFSGIKKRKIIYIVMSGLCLSYATATYLSMISILPSLILIYLYHLVVDKKETKLYLKFITCFSVSMIVGFIAIYGTCYRFFHHIYTLHSSIASGLYGNLHFKKFISFFFGLVQSFFALPYYGFKSTFFGEYSNAKIYFLWVLPITLISFLLIGGCYICVNIIKRDKKNFYILFIIFPFFLFSGLIPIYWDVIYPKLWLQPIAAFIISIIYLSVIYMRHNIIRLKSRFIIIYLIIFLVILMCWNFNRVLIRNHKGEPGVLKVAQQLDSVIENNSLIFAGWDKVDVVFRAFFPSKRLIMAVPELALDSFNEEGFLNKINAEIKKAKSEKRKIYFLGVLDLSKKTWDSFCGRTRAHINYESLQAYRKYCRIIKKYRIDQQEEIILYQYSSSYQ